MKKMRKLFRIVLVISLLIAMLPSTISATSNTAVWDGTTVDTDWHNTTDTNFEISSAAELAGLAKIVNDGTDDFQGDTIELVNNLDLAGFEWTPIGALDQPFKGTFNGENHTILNLTITDTTNDSTGLFGSINNGEINGIGIIDCNLNIEAYAGGLVGFIYDSTIENCFVTGNINGSGDIGGLVGGAVSARIKNCYTNVNVIGSDQLGGLAGFANIIAIENSYATGIVKGGYSTGGLVGCLLSSTVSNSYGNSSIIPKHFGSNGSEFIEGISGASLEQMKTEEFKNKLNGSEDAIQPFAIDPDFNDGYPYLVSFPQIMSGDKQVIPQGAKLTFKVTMPYFEGGTTTSVDGEVVPTEYTTYSSGSTIVTLSGEYINKLAPGTYTIDISNIDYGSVSGTFTVEKNDAPIITGLVDKTVLLSDVDGYDFKMDITEVIDDHSILTIDDVMIDGTIIKPKQGEKTESTITYTMSDDEGNTTVETIIITVTNYVPEISGLTDLEVVEGGSVDIKAGVTATDYEDGDITSTIVYPDTIIEELEVGKHVLEYTIVDSDNNTVTTLRTITVLEAVIDDSVDESVGPGTGDNTVVGGIVLLSLVSVVGMLLMRKKRSYNIF